MTHIVVRRLFGGPRFTLVSTSEISTRPVGVARLSWTRSKRFESRSVEAECEGIARLPFGERASHLCYSPLPWGAGVPIQPIPRRHRRRRQRRRRDRRSQLSITFSSLFWRMRTSLKRSVRDRPQLTLRRSSLRKNPANNYLRHWAPKFGELHRDDQRAGSQRRHGERLSRLSGLRSELHRRLDANDRHLDRARCVPGPSKPSRTMTAGQLHVARLLEFGTKSR